MGLVEVLVSLALLAVAVSALMGTSGTTLVGANTAERRTVEQRLARSQLELLENGGACGGSQPWKVDHTTYTVNWGCSQHPHYVEYKVEVADQSGGYTLWVDKALP